MACLKVRVHLCLEFDPAEPMKSPTSICDR